MRIINTAVNLSISEAGSATVEETVKTRSLEDSVISLVSILGYMKKLLSHVEKQSMTIDPNHTDDSQKSVCNVLRLKFCLTNIKSRPTVCME